MRILRKLALVLLILLAAAGLFAYVHSPERQLAWLDRADPAAMAADSARTGRAHFLAVCGYACATPGVGTLTYARCYAGAATVVTIDPTGDVVASRRHAALKEKAGAFAARYNALTLTALDRAGRRGCPAAERWDEYWRALDSLAAQIPARPNYSFVIALDEGRAARGDFQLHVQDERDDVAALRASACALAPRFGIDGRVRFALTSGDINDHPKAHPGFVCLRGVVAG
jgi:hypothetical protein